MTSDHRSIAFFGQAHMIDIILYIQSHPGCGRTDIYRNVARGDRMSDKIDILISRGLVEDSCSSRISILRLTPLGTSVAVHLEAIDGILTADIDRDL